MTMIITKNLIKYHKNDYKFIKQIFKIVDKELNIKFHRNYGSKLEKINDVDGNDKNIKCKFDCHLLVIGGGAGGCSVAAKFVRNLGKDKVCIIEPNEIHFYQPMFTLVGGGIKKICEAQRPMKDVLPKQAKWIKDRVKKFDPDNDKVETENGLIINYNYLVIACGIILNFEKIKGVSEGLSMENSGVCSNYLPEYAVKTNKVLNQLSKGNAIFNFPNTQIKCAGAPLKACLLTEHFSRLHNNRGNINFIFNTSLPVIFSAKYYADALNELFHKRDINTNFKKELISINPDKKEATFRLLDKTYQLETIQYSMLHVTPPMSIPSELQSAKTLIDESGFLDVDKHTLQHVKYKNIFGIGDCTNLPTSKTAAAVVAQCNIVFNNLFNSMKHKPFRHIYTGYTSCPLVTSYGKCILAEFDYEKNPVETFPFDQRKERTVSYYVKKDVLPNIYWLAMKGFWNGPQFIRKIFHFGYTK